MAAKPENLRDAKGWFNLANYDAVRNFSAHQWGQQIARRAFLRMAVDQNLQSALDEMVPPILSAPLFSWDYSSNAIPLRELKIGDLERLKGLIDDGLLNPCGSIDQHNAGLQPEDLGLSQFGHLVIDLNARDSDIKSGFDTWLREARSRRDKQLYTGAGERKRSIPSVEKLRAVQCP